MAEINVPTKNRVLVDTDHGFIVDSWDELRGGHFGGDALMVWSGKGIDSEAGYLRETTSKGRFV